MADAVVGRIKAVVTADATGLTTGLDRASKKLDNFGDKALRAGRTLTTRLTLPMVAVGTAAVKTATEFESSMTKITALVGVARDEVDRMAVTVRSMATQFGKSANEAADALFYITSAGLRGATASDTLAASLKASAIGLGETSTIADLATSALNAYGADTLSAAQATDVMTATIREGKLETTELATSMGRVLPLASAMGVNFNEVGAAFAALSRTGTNAAEAATQVRGILSSLLRPTKQAEDALTGMGLSSEELRSQLREEGLLATLKTLSDEFAGNEAAAAAVFGNIRALSGVLDLMGANVATTEQIFAAMTDTTGAVDEAFAQVAETTAFQFAQAMSEMRELLLSLGQSLLPQVNDALQFVAEAIRDITGFFRGLSPEVQGTIKALAGIVAIAGPAALAVGGVAKALGGLMALTPTTLAVTGAFIALGGAMAAMYAESREARLRAESLRDELTQLEDRLTTVVPKFQELVDTLAQQFPESPVEALTTELDNLAGRASLDAAIIESDLSDAFNAVGFDMEMLIRNLQGGGTSFQEFADNLPLAREQLEQVKSEFRQNNLEAMSLEGQLDTLSQVMETLLGRALSDNERRLLEHATALGYDQSQVKDLVSELEDLQTAFQDNINTTEEDAKAALTNAENLAVLNRALGDASVELIERYKAEARALGITEEYTYATEQLSKVLGYQSQAAQEALYFSTDLANLQLDLASSATAATADVGALATQLVEAADRAGYDALKTRDLIHQLGILDQLDPEVVVELGLDITGTAQVLRFVEQLIESQRQALMAAGDGRFIMRALEPLYNLRNALLSVGEEEEDTTSKTAGTSSAVDELARAAEEAAREAERLQEQVSRLGERVQDLGETIGDEDFFEFLLGASADQIEDKFKDIAKAAMELVEQADELGVAGGAEFLQFIGALGDEFDRLGVLQSDVVRTQDELSDVQSRLASATDDLAAAQQHLNDLTAQYAGTRSPTQQLTDATNALAEAQNKLNRENDRYAAFLYGEGAGGGTFEQVLQTEIEAYRTLQRELSGVESEQAGFRQRIIDMMSPTVAGAAGAGGVMGNLGNILAQARTFRNNLIELRDRGFPTDVIGQVVAAGMSQGNVISRRLLSLGTAEFAEFLALREQIGRIGVETAAIAGEVIFGADIAEAEGAVRDQFAIVDRMFQSAITEAEQAHRAQEAVVEALFQNAIAEAEAAVRVQEETVERLRATLGALQARLLSLQDQVAVLAGDIQTALTAAFTQFLDGFNAAITRVAQVANVPAPPVASPAQVSRPASAPDRVVSPTPGPAPAPAPAPAPLAPLGVRYPERQIAPPTPQLAYRGLRGGAGGGPVRMMARGGRVGVGRPYLVGEAGPELFVPEAAGNILSNRDSRQMAAATVNYNIAVTANGDPAEAGRQIVKAIQEYERRNGNRWRSS